VAIRDWFKGEEKNIVEEFSPIMYINEQEVIGNNVKFKGEVEENKKKFPDELGEEHPFDFSICEGLYKKMGFVTAVVDKFVDFVVGPGFYIECKDEKGKEIIEQFMLDVNFDTLIRGWIKEALIKGNGFLEIGGSKEEIRGLKVLNANYMYVNRNEKGIINSYNQYTGGFKRFDKSKVIPFDKWEIAHIGFNKIGDCPYGLGIVSPAISTLNNLLQNEKDLHMLMNRKANTPYTIKMGAIVGGKYYKPNKSDIDAMGEKLEWLNNKHEWVHDGLTEIKALDFGNVGDKFSFVLEHDVDMLFYIFQIPAVLMGMARIPEGLAKVQMDAFERRIISIQAEVEKVIENDLFKRILQSNGIEEHVEFEWGRPSNMERYERLEKLTELMKIPVISGSLINLIEKDVVNILGYDEDEYKVLSGEEEREREEERPQPIVPGQNRGTPQLPEEHICPHCLDIKEGSYNKIEEWLGFNYKKYLKNILKANSKEKFDFLAAKNAIEEKAGLLSTKQIESLREVLDDGFKNERSIREIANNIKNKVKPQDLLKIENGVIVSDAGIPIVVKGKESRDIAIARSEITRVANEGAVEHFKEGGVKKVRWIASYGRRTCPECEALNNQIFDIDKHPQIPLHTMCRCTLLPVQEVF
jgi:SPP1 gp7 family putative phage head morphogenesis protein